MRAHPVTDVNATKPAGARSLWPPRVLAAVSLMLAAGIPAAHPAEASVKGPGIYAPATVSVGQKVTVRTVFRARDLARNCFMPTATFGALPKDEVAFPAMCVIGAGSGSRDYRLQESVHTFAYPRPGTYTVTVDASYQRDEFSVPQSGDPHLLDPRPPAPGMVKGPARLTATIVVTDPEQAEVSDERKAVILQDGYRAADRASIVELLNALKWPTAWLPDLGLDPRATPPTIAYPDPAVGGDLRTVQASATIVDYYVVGSAQFLVARFPLPVGTHTRWFANDPQLNLPCGGSVRVFAEAMNVPLEARIESERPLAVAGKTYSMWSFSNGVYAGSRPQQ